MKHWAKYKTAIKGNIRQRKDRLAEDKGRDRSIFHIEEERLVK